MKRKHLMRNRLLSSAMAVCMAVSPAVYAAAEETTAAGENKTADGNVKTGDFANPWVFAFGMVTALMTGSAVFSAKARKKVQKKTGKK